MVRLGPVEDKYVACDNFKSLWKEYGKIISKISHDHKQRSFANSHCNCENDDLRLIYYKHFRYSNLHARTFIVLIDVANKSIFVLVIDSLLSYCHYNKI